MRKFVICMLLVLPALTLFANANKNGIDFKNISFAEAKKLAKAQNKAIFVDFYASWCGPCKWMDKNVFVDEQVASYFNKHFISIKVDTDTGKEIELISSLNVNSIPTYAFFKPDGELLLNTTGAMVAKDFIALAQTIKDWKLYLTDNFDLNTAKNKLAALQLLSFENPTKANEVATSYIQSLVTRDKNLSSATEDDWLLINEFVVKEIDGESFDESAPFLSDIDLHLLNNVEGIASTNWNEPLVQYYEATFDYMLESAARTLDTDKVTALNKPYTQFKTIEDEGVFDEKSYPEYNWLRYHTMVGNTEYFLENADQWLNKYHKEEPNYYLDLGITLAYYCEEDKCNDKVESLFQGAIALDDNILGNILLGTHYMNTAQYDKMKPLLNKAALEFKDHDYYYMFENWQETINSL